MLRVKAAVREDLFKKVCADLITFVMSETLKHELQKMDRSDVKISGKKKKRLKHLISLDRSFKNVFLFTYLFFHISVCILVLGFADRQVRQLPAPSRMLAACRAYAAWILQCTLAAGSQVTPRGSHSTSRTHTIMNYAMWLDAARENPSPHTHTHDTTNGLASLVANN